MSFLGSLRNLMGQKMAEGATEPVAAPEWEPGSVDDLIERHLRARGGRERLAAVQALRMTGRVTGGELKNFPVMVLKKRPDRYLRRIEDRGSVTLQAVDREIAWEHGEAIEAPRPAAMARAAVRRFRRLADFDGVWIDAEAKGHKLELAGRERVEGVGTFKIKATFEGAERPGFYFFDPRTFLLIKNLEMAPAPEGGVVPTETWFRDFREVGGLLWPFTEVLAVPRLGVRQTFTWESIEVDVPLEDEIFRMPQR